eukprot:SM000078S22136  [mRNA]  locus=s78:511747:512052:- [translate_table: standard]
MLTMLTAGGLAGALSWVACYPLDVAKSRLQAQGANGGRRFKGIWHCLRTSVAEEGVAVLFRGLGTTMVRAYLVNGAIFTAYEMTLRALAITPSPPPQRPGF